MMKKMLLLFLVTFVPAFELRASIPLGILSGSLALPFHLKMQGMGIDWKLVFLICVAANALLGLILYPFLDIFFKYIKHFPKISRLWDKIIVKSQKKVKPYVEKWGMLGIAFFVAIPLPGSGSYSGSVGAYLLGLSYRQFVLANTLGVILAGIAVTITTLGLEKVFS